MKRIKLLIAAMVCLLSLSLSAQVRKVEEVPLARLSNIEGPNVIVQNILANPRFNAMDPVSSVSEFTISFNVKGGEYLGPYTIKGDRLTAHEIGIIRGLPVGSRIFVEHVQLQRGVNELSAKPILLKVAG